MLQKQKIFSCLSNSVILYRFQDTILVAIINQLILCLNQVEVKKKRSNRIQFPRTVYPNRVSKQWALMRSIIADSQ